MAQNTQLCETLHKYNLPCPCPIPAGSYGTPASGIEAHIKNPGISWLTDGDFYVKVTLDGNSVGELGCIEAYFSLKSI